MQEDVSVKRTPPTHALIKPSPDLMFVHLKKNIIISSFLVIDGAMTFCVAAPPRALMIAFIWRAVLSF